MSSRWYVVMLIVVSQYLAEATSAWVASQLAQYSRRRARPVRTNVVIMLYFVCLCVYVFVWVFVCVRFFFEITKYLISMKYLISIWHFLKKDKQNKQKRFTSHSLSIPTLANQSWWQRAKKNKYWITSNNRESSRMSAIDVCKPAQRERCVLARFLFAVLMKTTCVVWNNNNNTRLKCEFSRITILNTNIVPSTLSHLNSLVAGKVCISFVERKNNNQNVFNKFQMTTSVSNDRTSVRLSLLAHGAKNNCRFCVSDSTFINATPLLFRRGTIIIFG